MGHRFRHIKKITFSRKTRCTLIYQVGKSNRLFQALSVGHRKVGDYGYVCLNSGAQTSPAVGSMATLIYPTGVQSIGLKTSLLNFYIFHCCLDGKKYQKQ